MDDVTIPSHKIPEKRPSPPGPLPSAAAPAASGTGNGLPPPRVQQHEIDALVRVGRKILQKSPSVATLKIESQSHFTILTRDPGMAAVLRVAVEYVMFERTGLQVGPSLVRACVEHVNKTTPARRPRPPAPSPGT